MNNFELKDNNIRISQNKINFENYKIISISSPYIALNDENKIQFCLNNYEKIIGPIIPSLYINQLFKFNIISFIDKNLEAKLKIKDENSVLKNYISISELIEPENSIQIIYRNSENPNIDYNHENEIIVNGSFEIKIKNEEVKLDLPFTFYFRFIPLILFFECSKNLFYENKLFKF